ncbi:hypothetical protein KSS87_001147 [Heliosperma pusillum]|nr:hypothetical protein KSS87_001147 [Heliosperma pusillum]
MVTLRGASLRGHASSDVGERSLAVVAGSDADGERRLKVVNGLMWWPKSVIMVPWLKCVDSFLLNQPGQENEIGNVFNKLVKQLANPVEFELPDCACINKPFQNRPVKKMKLVKTEKCGSGIVADEDIKQGEFVIEYVGEVIDDKECEERLWKMKHRGETNFYLCEVNRDMVIDATYKGNKSRYINHCCCPNTEMQKWSIDGETRIGIFATRDINKGEHLTYDYQFVQFGADQDCHCGAVSCRRKLGVKPNKTSSEAALKLVARQVCQNGGVRGGMTNSSRSNSNNCIGEVVMILRHENTRQMSVSYVSLFGPVNLSIRGLEPGGVLCFSSLSSMFFDDLSFVYSVVWLVSCWLFGIIKRFDNFSKKHLIMFEDGAVEFIDMSKEEWDVCNLLL